MITAHLPSGYVLARSAGWKKAMLAAALLGAVFPDIDLAWFYLVDDRAFHHHRYWVHAPFFALMASGALVLIAAAGAPRLAGVAVAFAAGWLLHILLDAPTGSLMWLWPLTDTLYAPIEVPARRSHWVLSFLTHWSILFELAVWLAAAALFLKGRRA